MSRSSGRLILPIGLALTAGALSGCGADGTDGGGGVSAPPGPAWPGKASFVAVSVANTCAVATNGTGYCWGANSGLQLTWPHVVVTPTSGFNPCREDTGGNSYNEWPCTGHAPVLVTGGDKWKTLTYSFEGPPRCDAIPAKMSALPRRAGS